MKRKFQHIAYLLMVAAVITSCGEKKQTSEFPDWAWADFQRPEGINPIVSPDTTTVFYCPMRQDSVAWESSDTLIRLLQFMMVKWLCFTGQKIIRR